MNLSKSVYQVRRARLMDSLPNGAVVVLKTASLCTRNNDCEFEFRPNSDFFYLTGFPEPDAYVVITATGKAHLFSLAKDPEKELWEGFRYGVEGAMETFGLDQVSPISNLSHDLPLLLDAATSVYFAFADTQLHSAVMTACTTLSGRVRAGAVAPAILANVTPVLAEMRLIKDAQEIELMEKAAQISVLAHRKAMQTVRPGMMEYELEAELNYCFMKSGARQPAYSNIVAAGKNACTLHYIRNNAQIQEGDLVLIDAGCELGCYASDISRTFPANGKFSEPQAALYQVVLAAYYAGLAKLNIGEAYEACHNAAVKVITSGLVELGLLQGEVDSLIESKAYRDFYMHNTGHWIGLDVHDAGLYQQEGKSRLLEAGMALTLEPGIYVSPHNLNVAPNWRGIGIRIEDDIVITEQGPYVLTHGLAKEIADIEALMASK